jgi:hypothetical protein
MDNKTHYRVVDKSDYLGSADIEQLIEDKQSTTFTIKSVAIERGIRVNGKKGDFRIARFAEKIKPMVLNATNGKRIHQITGSPFVEDWKDIAVELYIEEGVKNPEGGDPVTGLRLRRGKVAPKQLKDFTPSHPKWNDAVSRVASGEATADTIRQHFTLSDANESRLLAEVEQLQSTGEVA